VSTKCRHKLLFKSSLLDHKLWIEYTCCCAGSRLERWSIRTRWRRCFLRLPTTTEPIRRCAYRRCPASDGHRRRAPPNRPQRTATSTCRPPLPRSRTSTSTRATRWYSAEELTRWPPRASCTRTSDQTERTSRRPSAAAAYSPRSFYAVVSCATRCIACIFSCNNCRLCIALESLQLLREKMQRVAHETTTPLRRQQIQRNRATLRITWKYSYSRIVVSHVLCAKAGFVPTTIRRRE